jgi:hypothetical protein
MEPQRIEGGGIARSLKAPARWRIKSAAEAVGEDVVVGSDELPAATETIERGSSLIRKRNLANRRLLVDRSSVSPESARPTGSSGR